MSIDLLLYIIAAVLFTLAALGVGKGPWLPLGLLAWVLTNII